MEPSTLTAAADAGRTALSGAGVALLIVLAEALSLVSFFLATWCWGRLIRREPAGTMLQAASGFGLSFGALTITPAGLLVWAVCGANTGGLTAAVMARYITLTALLPALIYYTTFRLAGTPFIRIAGHLLFGATVSAGFDELFSLNRMPGATHVDTTLPLLWMGMFMVFSSWEAHGWAFVEQVPAAEGFRKWFSLFTGEHRQNFLRMSALWHFYFVAGLVIVLNHALSYVEEAPGIAYPVNLYAAWVHEIGHIESTLYSLAIMAAVLMAVYIETMGRTRQTRDVAITGQEALEADLRITQARYAAVLQNAPYAVVQFDRNLRVDVENTQAVRLLQQIAPGRRPGDGSLPLPDEFLRICHEVFQGAQTSVEGELVRQPQQRASWFRMTCEPVMDASGECIAAVAVLDDQTERYHRETELKQVMADAEFARSAAQSANLAKSRFLANMSHEIRTPMNGIYSAIQLLGDPRLTDEKRPRVLDTMKRSADSMIKLLNDILDLSKVEAGAMKLKLKPLQLAPLGHGVLNLFQAAAHMHQLELRLDCALPDTEPVMADELRLQQMLSNLVGNAIKFTQKGSITLQISKLSAEADGDGHAIYRFSVTDTGAGIDSESLRTLFNAYHQLENQLKGTSDEPAVKGTGLGLTIVKHLAELMKGRVGADSTPGVGSTFWFEIPLARAANN